MSKAKMLGYYKPFTPNAKAVGKHGKKAPWQGEKQKNDNPVRKNFFDEFIPLSTATKKEVRK